MKPKIFISRDIAPSAVQILREKCEITGQWNSEKEMPRQDFLKSIKDCDGILICDRDKVNAELFDAAPNVKVVSTFSVGYDHFDLEECKKRNAIVGHTPNVLTDSVAEYTIGLMMVAGRRYFEGAQQVRDGIWTHSGIMGKSIKGSTVGIIGFGRIGQAVAEKLKGIDPETILYYDVIDSFKEGQTLGADFAKLDDLLSRSDFIVPCCNLTDESKRLFNPRTFGLMKKGALFVNASRGSVVDHDALYDALKSGHLAGAAIDVCDPEPLPADHKLLGLKNCVVFPHMASATRATREQMALLAAHNLIAGLEGNPLPAPIPGSTK